MKTIHGNFIKPSAYRVHSCCDVHFQIHKKRERTLSNIEDRICTLDAAMAGLGYLYDENLARIRYADIPEVSRLLEKHQKDILHLMTRIRRLFFKYDGWRRSISYWIDLYYSADGRNYRPF